MARYRKVDSYLSDEQKAARRAALGDLVTAALERLEDADGWRQYLISETIYQDRAGFKTGLVLTPLNLALAAMQAPGQAIGPYQAFPVRKGMRSDTVIVGRTFWPRAVWRTGQFAGLHEDLIPAALPDPCPEKCEEIARLWSDLPNTAAALADFVALNAGRLEDAAGPGIETVRPPNAAEYVFDGSDIPF
jgi:hypothetical protein